MMAAFTVVCIISENLSIASPITAMSWPATHWIPSVLSLGWSRLWDLGFLWLTLSSICWVFPGCHTLRAGTLKINPSFPPWHPFLNPIQLKILGVTFFPTFYVLSLASQLLPVLPVPHLLQVILYNSSLGAHLGSFTQGPVSGSTLEGPDLIGLGAAPASKSEKLLRGISLQWEH